MILFNSQSLNGVINTTIDVDRQISQQFQTANTIFRKPRKKLISVSQLNQHRSYKAAENHRDWFHDNVGKNKTYRLGICLIQEPFLRKNRLSLFDGLEIFQYQGDERVRACIAVSKNIEAWPVIQFTNPDQCVIGFKNNHKTILVSSTYMPHPPIHDPDIEGPPPKTGASGVGEEGAPPAPTTL